MRFTANSVTYQVHNGIATLGFADDELDTRQYVMLQRELVPLSPEDREAGFGMLHIEVNSQAHSGYGAAVKAQLQERRFILILDPQTAAALSVDDTIEIAFHVPKEELNEIGDQLCLLFGDRAELR